MFAAHSNTVTIPLPPSSHHKDVGAKARWREDALATLQGAPQFPKMLLRLTFGLYYRWQRADGTPDPKAEDWDRLVTPLQDIVGAACGFNDRWVVAALVERVQSDRREADVTIELI